MHNETIFTTQKVNKKLHEDVQDVCLVTKEQRKLLVLLFLHVSYRVIVEGLFRHHDWKPSHGRIHLK